MNGSWPQISLRTSQLKSWQMLVISGRKLVSKVLTLRSEFSSAMAPMRRALEVLTANVWDLYDIR